MKNELLTIGPVTIHGYGLMIGIGVIAAYLTAEYRARKLKLDADQVFSLVIWCLVFGGLGSKLLFCLTQLDTILADPSYLLHSLANGWVVYGGLIGGVLGGFLFCRHKKINFLSYFDLALPSVALAQGLWPHRLLPCRLLLRTPDGQRPGDYLYQFRLCAEWYFPDPHPADLKRAGFPSFLRAAVHCEA